MKRELQRQQWDRQMEQQQQQHLLGQNQMGLLRQCLGLGLQLLGLPDWPWRSPGNWTSRTAAFQMHVTAAHLQNRCQFQLLLYKCQMSGMRFDMSGSVNTAFHDVCGGMRTTVSQACRCLCGCG